MMMPDANKEDLICPQIINLWTTIFIEQHKPQHNGMFCILHEHKLLY